MLIIVFFFHFYYNFYNERLLERVEIGKDLELMDNRNVTVLIFLINWAI